MTLRYMPRVLTVTTLLVTFHFAIAQKPVNNSSQKTNAKAVVTLTASKTNLTVGECSMIELAFIVQMNNTVPLQFYELPTQITKLEASLSADAFIFNNEITDVVAHSTNFNGTEANIYPIYQGAVCPTKPGDLIISDFTLSMASPHRTEISNPKSDTLTEIILFLAKTIVIHAKPLPAGVLSAIDPKYQLPIVGDLKSKEHLSSENIKVFETVDYRLTISGKGHLAALAPTIIKSEMCDVEFVDEQRQDTIQDNEVESNHTLVYRITAKRAGVIQTNKLFRNISYYNTRTKKLEQLQLQSSLNVEGTIAKPKQNTLASDTTKAYIVLVDVSQSMMMEDYSPNRFTFLKRQIRNLIDKKYPIEIIFFSGSQQPYQLHSVQTLPWNLIELNNISTRGTAIGDAIMYALRLTSNRNYQRELFLIGDGDQTSGFFSPKLAASLAKRTGFKIHSIGIGTDSLVPLKGQFYDKTFSSKTLKLIASQTGGRYLYLDKGKTLEDLIKPVIQATTRSTKEKH